MNNPFETLSARLDGIEEMIQQVLQRTGSPAQTGPEIGGLELAREVTGLSKARIYALVSEREIPHSKRGNKLYFNRAELSAWVMAGKRGYNKTAANA